MNDELPVPNKDLLQKTLAHIEANPQSWDQRFWFCGTTACVAGWACRLSDEVKEINEEDQEVVLKDGRVLNVGPAARKLLGLTRFEAECLFASANDIHAVRHRVRLLVEDGYHESFGRSE